MPTKLTLSTLPLRRWAIGIGLALAVFPFGMPESAVAQVGTVNPLDDFKPQDNRDPFSNTGNSQGGMLDIIHRANLGNSRSINDYSQEQQENLNSAAAVFRAKQLERLRTTGTTPTNAIPANTPVAPATAPRTN